MLSVLDDNSSKYSVYNNILKDLDENILEMNLRELEGTQITLITSDEIIRCKYNPKYMSWKYFETPDLWYLILRMNKLSSPIEMDTTKRKTWTIPSKDDLSKLSLIISSHKAVFD